MAWVSPYEATRIVILFLQGGAILKNQMENMSVDVSQ